MTLIRALVGNPLDDRWYQPSSWGMGSSAGVPVTPTTALEHSAVWACVRLLSESLAMLPLIIYQRQSDGGKSRATQHPLYDLLHDRPNFWQTSFAWRRVMMTHALLWGNGYSQIMAGARGPVDQLVPIHPDRIRAERIPSGVRYQVRQADGTEQPLNAEDVFHLPGLSLDGISGLSVMQYARESIGIGLAAQQYTGKFFGNGARPGGILSFKGNLSKDAKQRLREEWQAVQGGTANLHKVAVLEEGAEWKQTGVTNEDAQLLGTLTWSNEEAARRFNVPLHLIQEVSKATTWGSGIAELNLGFLTHSLTPWLVNWEQTISKDLIVAPVFFAEFLTDALLRVKTLERFQAYQLAVGGGTRGAGWMTRNEVRTRENLNPLPGLDDVLMPAIAQEEGPGAPPSNDPADAPMTPPPSRNGAVHHDDIRALLAPQGADA